MDGAAPMTPAVAKGIDGPYLPSQMRVALRQDGLEHRAELHGQKN